MAFFSFPLINFLILCSAMEEPRQAVEVEQDEIVEVNLNYIGKDLYALYRYNCSSSYIDITAVVPLEKADELLNNPDEADQFIKEYIRKYKI